jgi:hypothetical protein
MDCPISIGKSKLVSRRPDSNRLARSSGVSETEDGRVGAGAEGGALAGALATAMGVSVGVADSVDFVGVSDEAGGAGAEGGALAGALATATGVSVGVADSVVVEVSDEAGGAAALLSELAAGGNDPIAGSRLAVSLGSSCRRPRASAGDKVAGSIGGRAAEPVLFVESDGTTAGWAFWPVWPVRGIGRRTGPTNDSICASCFCRPAGILLRENLDLSAEGGGACGAVRGS